jgi:hypothetical protein
MNTFIIGYDYGYGKEIDAEVAQYATLFDDDSIFEDHNFQVGVRVAESEKGN